MKKKKLTYRPCPLEKIMVVNGLKFNEIIISSHYEENHGSYLTDEKILKKLDKKSGFAPKLRGELTDKTEWQSFSQEPFCYDKKAYRLVWHWEIDIPHL